MFTKNYSFIWNEISLKLMVLQGFSYEDWRFGICVPTFPKAILVYTKRRNLNVPKAKLSLLFFVATVYIPHGVFYICNRFLVFQNTPVETY